MGEKHHLFTRRWKGGTIEPHPTEKALIVNYKLEAAVFGEPGDPMLEDRKVSHGAIFGSSERGFLAMIFARGMRREETKVIT